MSKIFFLLISLATSTLFAFEWEVRTAPIAFLPKWITLDLSYLANRNWAFGPSIIRYANEERMGGMLAPTYYGWAAGAHLIYADSFVEDSLYASSHAYLEDYISYRHSALGFNENKGSKVSGDIGKRWVWTSTSISMMLGFGLEFKNHAVVYNSDSGTRSEDRETFGLFHIEYKVGYLF